MPTLRYGVYLPTYGPFADPATLVRLGIATADAGWDGFFLWDHITSAWPRPQPTTDPWLVLSAVAAQRPGLQVGPLVTPLARRELSKFVHEVVTLDHLSGGHAVVGVGLGEVDDMRAFGLEADKRRRAEDLDRKLAQARALLDGATTEILGNVAADDARRVLPGPASRPGVPIWGAGRWTLQPDGTVRANHGPWRRAAGLSGVFPVSHRWEPPAGLVGPPALARLVELMRRQYGVGDDFEFVQGAVSTDAEADRALVAQYRDAGMTYWLESFHPNRGDADSAMRRIGAGPPRLVRP